MQALHPALEALERGAHQAGPVTHRPLLYTGSALVPRQRSSAQRSTMGCPRYSAAARGQRRGGGPPRLETQAAQAGTHPRADPCTAWAGSSPPRTGAAARQGLLASQAPGAAPPRHQGRRGRREGVGRSSQGGGLARAHMVHIPLIDPRIIETGPCPYPRMDALAGEAREWGLEEEGVERRCAHLAGPGWPPPVLPGGSERGRVISAGEEGGKEVRAWKHRAALCSPALITLP